MPKETSNGKKGGLLKGKPHEDKNGNSIGGIKAVVGDAKQPIELEGGEVIINKEASKKYWRELSEINQSAGNGVAILPPDKALADTEEYRNGGNTIEFNPNTLPNKWVCDYANNIKTKYPKVWDLVDNKLTNEAYNNLQRVSKRGHWLDSEEWFYFKWKSFTERFPHTTGIKDVLTSLKWCTINKKGWNDMKAIIQKEIDKQYPTGWKHRKLALGGSADERAERRAERKEARVQLREKRKGIIPNYEVGDTFTWSGTSVFEITQITTDSVKYREVGTTKNNSSTKAGFDRLVRTGKWKIVPQPKSDVRILTKQELIDTYGDDWNNPDNLGGLSFVNDMKSAFGRYLTIAQLDDLKKNDLKINMGSSVGEYYYSKEMTTLAPLYKPKEFNSRVNTTAYRHATNDAQPIFRIIKGVGETYNVSWFVGSYQEVVTYEKADVEKYVNGGIWVAVSVDDLVKKGKAPKKDKPPVKKEINFDDALNKFVSINFTSVSENNSENLVKDIITDFALSIEATDKADAQKVKGLLKTT